MYVNWIWRNIYKYNFNQSAVIVYLNIASENVIYMYAMSAVSRRQKHCKDMMLLFVSAIPNLIELDSSFPMPAKSPKWQCNGLEYRFYKCLQ